MAFIGVQVVYRQGLVKSFVMPGEIKLGAFLGHLKRLGKFRSIRFLRDLNEQEAEEMTREGAMVVRVEQQPNDPSNR